MARPAVLDRTGILEVSLALADAGGVENVTMAAVARELGVTPMALYRHVADKADLLDGLVECLLTQIPLPPQTVPWTERLRALARSTRGVAQRHPHVFPLLFTRPANTPRALAARYCILDALREAGLPEATAARTERLLSTVILGFSASEAGGRFREHPQERLDQDFAWLEEVIEQVMTGVVAGQGGGDLGAN
jgi:AcrR family transcriptional regulator